VFYWASAINQSIKQANKVRLRNQYSLKVL